MAAKHGKSTRYTQGCRCDACKDAHRLRAADYPQRLVTRGALNRYQGSDSPDTNVTPSPVESAVTAGIADSVQAADHPAPEPPGEEPAPSYPPQFGIDGFDVAPARSVSSRVLSALHRLTCSSFARRPSESTVR